MIPGTLASLIQAFGHAVVHSLWQIALIWLIFKLLEWRFGRNHQLVYLLSLAAMLASTLWAAHTFFIHWTRVQQVATVETVYSDIETLFTPQVLTTGPGSELSVWQSLQFWLEAHSALIGWVWLLCAALLWLRLMGSWWLAQRVRKRNVQWAAEAFQSLCTDWAKRLKIQASIPLLESPHISEPLTMGFWNPVVLFPVGMLLQLSPAQVEVLLLHELAHIRRKDYLVNLFQLVLEVCFFYHPLFWLLSREARSRREFCCDKMVLKYSSDPMLYAKTLTDLQCALVHLQTQFTMNATGKSRFTERILHIVGISPKRSNRPNLLLLLLLPLALALSSWWPVSPDPITNASNTEAPAGITQDSTAPRNKVQDTRIAQPKSEAGKTLEQVAEDLGNKYPNQRVSINTAPEVSENVAIEVVKMNVLYIGVDNPLRVAAAGVPANELQVKLIGSGNITGKDGNYIATVTQPGEVTIRAIWQVGEEIKMVVDQKCRVKRIPDPAPKLDGKYRSCKMKISEFQKCKSISSVLENFVFDAYCEVESFEATYLPRGADPYTLMISGGTFDARLLEIMKAIRPGDSFFFDNIIVLCPGDKGSRNLGGLAYKMEGD